VSDLLVNLDVDDLDKAARFYSSVFELRAGRRLGAVGLEMLGCSSPIYLLERSATAPAETTSLARTYQRHWTPVHLDFVVGEIEPAVERAVLAGAVLEKPIQVFEWGKLALMADPFGHGFCFVQFVGRGYEEIAE
jgi:predicted enzyme related to lactoylglutathione lyase